MRTGGRCSSMPFMQPVRMARVHPDPSPSMQSSGRAGMWGDPHDVKELTISGRNAKALAGLRQIMESMAGGPSRFLCKLAVSGGSHTLCRRNAVPGGPVSILLTGRSQAARQLCMHYCMLDPKGVILSHEGL
ncbi:hypothetical protein WJX73_010465 [Symbiochloris irregularis]